MILSLILLPIFSILGYLGGQPRMAWCRDFVIPAIVSIVFIIKSPFYYLSTNFIVGLCLFGSCNIIRFGYGAYDPVNDDKPSLLAKFTKDKDGWVIRTVWALFVSLISLSPYIFASILGYSYSVLIKSLIFCTIFSLVCFLVVRMRRNILITDLSIWFTYGLITFCF